MNELPEGFCYSTGLPHQYLPHDTTHVFFAKYAAELPTWNMLWLTQPMLDACLGLDKSKWYQWGPIVKAMDAELIGLMAASFKIDDEAVPAGMSLRQLLTLHPDVMLPRLQQRAWREMPMFEDVKVMNLIESRLGYGLSEAVEAIESASRVQQAVVERVGSVVYAKFGKAKLAP